MYNKMNKAKARQISKERIEILFDEAKEAVLEGDIERANRYVDLARKVGMKYNQPIPSESKRRVCKNCYSYLFPSVTSRVRVRKGKLVARCNRCGHINRYIYKKGGSKDG